MRLFLLVAVLAGAALLLPVRAEADAVTWDTVGAWIVEDAAHYGVGAYWLLSVAWCEARGNPYAVGRAGEIGPFQFHPRGIWWDLPASRVVPLDFSTESLRMQVRAAVRAFSLGLSYHWSCA